jgi:hypothetical protein
MAVVKLDVPYHVMIHIATDVSSSVVMAQYRRWPAPPLTETQERNELCHNIFVDNLNTSQALEGQTKRIKVNLFSIKKKANKLRGLSPRANYTDGETAVCRRS